MSWLRNILFAVAFYGGSFLLVLLAPLTSLLPRAVSIWLGAAWSRWHRWCVRHLLGIEVVVEGERPAFQALYAIRHESFFEAIDAPTFTGGPVIPFAKIELMRLPLWGRAAAAYGVIGVDRGSGSKALRHMARQAAEARESGRDFVIFPEGTRVPHGETGKVQAGLYGTFKAVGLPVVPVAVDSGPAYAAWPKRRGTITYRIGEAIAPGTPRAELESRVTEAINALNPTR